MMFFIVFASSTTYTCARVCDYGITTNSHAVDVKSVHGTFPFALPFPCKTCVFFSAEKFVMIFYCVLLSSVF